LLAIHWLKGARADVSGIIRHIAIHNKSAARKMKNLFELSVLPVSEHPYLYRTSERVPGCREIVVHPNYIVFCRVTAHCIDVVALYMPGVIFHLIFISFVA
jgi:toxin ParE1/3/4